MQRANLSTYNRIEQETELVCSSYDLSSLFGHDSSPNCPVCADTEEDADHVMFYCCRFENRRPQVPPNEITSAMIGSAVA